MSRFRKDKEDSINRYLTALSIYRLNVLNGNTFTCQSISKQLSISNTIFSCAQELGILRSSRNTKEWLAGVPDEDMAIKVNILVRKKADEASLKSRTKLEEDPKELTLKDLNSNELFEIVKALRSDQTANFNMISECSKAIIKLNKELDIPDPHLRNALEIGLETSKTTNETYRNFLNYLQAMGFVHYGRRLK